MGQLIVPDPTSVITFMEDFLKYDPGDWFVSRLETGATAGSETISDASGGIFVVTNATGDDDYTFYQYKSYSHVSTASELFTLASGKKLWFKARLKASDVTQSDFFVGLISANTIPLTSSVDAVWFYKNDGDAYLDFGMYAASVATMTDVELASLTDDTYFTVGFYWDGVNEIQYFYNDAIQGSSTVSVPSAELAISFGIRNGAAAAKILSVDYICCVKER